MPELPEVETIKRQLGEVLVGLVIEKVEVLSEKSWVGDPEWLIGGVVREIRRRGKGLVIDVETKKREGLSVVAHLKMTGQLIYEPHGSGAADHVLHRIVGGHPTGDFISTLPSKHTRVMVTFVYEDGRPGGRLYFNDQRKFGWMKLMPTDQVEQLDFIQSLGPEPWEMSDEQWMQIFETNKPVKVRLMDQDQVAGIGNIYANDALWEAEIDPRRAARSLSVEERMRLKQMVIKVLEEGVFYEGATAFDGKFVDLKGLGGMYQEHFRVYQREGEVCLRSGCGGSITKVMLGGRGTFWCERCQH